MIISIFVFTQLPQGLILLIDFDLYIRLGDLFDILSLLNNSVNFMFYCTMSEGFRNVFQELFCSCLKNPNSSSSNSAEIRETHFKSKPKVPRALSGSGIFPPSLVPSADPSQQFSDEEGNPHIDSTPHLLSPDTCRKPKESCLQKQS